MSELKSLVDAAAVEIELSATKLWMPPCLDDVKKESPVTKVAPRKRKKLYSPTRYHHPGELEWNDVKEKNVPVKAKPPGIRSGKIADYGLFVAPNSTRSWVWEHHVDGKRPDRFTPENGPAVGQGKGESVYRDMLNGFHRSMCNRGELYKMPFSQLQRRVATLNYVSRYVSYLAIQSYK